jgi:DNA-binding MarR family transcriptional regulator
MPADDVHPNDPLLIACRQIGRAMDLFDETAAHRLALGRSDLRALNLLEHGPLSAAALADQLSLTRTAVTALIDRLVHAGYASRTPDPIDRRSIRVALEPATWRAFADVYRPLGQHVATATTHLDQHERHTVIAALNDIQQAFDSARRHLSELTGQVTTAPIQRTKAVGPAASAAV